MALVERVPPAETAELRQRVLRPHQTVEEVGLPGDDEPTTACFVVRDEVGGAVLSTASVRLEPPPWNSLAPSSEHAPHEPVPPAAVAAAGHDDSAAWRLRGMATSEERRGEGLGALVMAAVLAHVAEAGGGLLWCTARVPAAAFYHRAGFEQLGAQFEEPMTGPHVVMWRVVEP